MENPAFIDRVKALQLPPDHFIVIGSGVMGALGIRESNDIDLAVSQDLFDALVAEGWHREIRHNEAMLTHEDVEVWRTWGTPGAWRTFEQLLEDSVIISGIAFCSLDYVLQVKKMKARPKDLEDVVLIESYLQQHE